MAREVRVAGSLQVIPAGTFHHTTVTDDVNLGIVSSDSNTCIREVSALPLQTLHLQHFSNPRSPGGEARGRFPVR